MSNLVDVDLKASVEQGFEDIFDTFARDITFTLYKNPTETILSLDNNFNYDWENKDIGNNANITYSEVSQAFPARIWFMDYEQQLKLFSFEGEKIEGIRAARSISKVKIQIKESAHNFIQTATRAVFMGENWSIISDPKKIGIFDFKYYTYILQKQI